MTLSDFDFRRIVIPVGFALSAVLMMAPVTAFARDVFSASPALNDLSNDEIIFIRELNNVVGRQFGGIYFARRVTIATRADFDALPDDIKKTIDDPDRFVAERLTESGMRCLVLYRPLFEYALPGEPAVVRIIPDSLTVWQRLAIDAHPNMTILVSIWASSGKKPASSGSKITVIQLISKRVADRLQAVFSDAGVKLKRVTEKMLTGEDYPTGIVQHFTQHAINTASDPDAVRAARAKRILDDEFVRVFNLSEAQARKYASWKLEDISPYIRDEDAADYVYGILSAERSAVDSNARKTSRNWRWRRRRGIAYPPLLDTLTPRFVFQHASAIFKKLDLDAMEPIEALRVLATVANLRQVRRRIHLTDTGCLSSSIGDSRETVEAFKTAWPVIRGEYRSLISRMDDSERLLLVRSWDSLPLMTRLMQDTEFAGFLYDNLYNDTTRDNLTAFFPLMFEDTIRRKMLNTIFHDNNLLTQGRFIYFIPRRCTASDSDIRKQFGELFSKKVFGDDGVIRAKYMAALARLAPEVFFREANRMLVMKIAAAQWDNTVPASPSDLSGTSESGDIMREKSDAPIIPVAARPDDHNAVSSITVDIKRWKDDPEILLGENYASIIAMKPPDDIEAKLARQLLKKLTDTCFRTRRMNRFLVGVQYQLQHMDDSIFQSGLTTPDIVNTLSVDVTRRMLAYRCNVTQNFILRFIPTEKHPFVDDDDDWKVFLQESGVGRIQTEIEALAYELPDKPAYHQYTRDTMRNYFHGRYGQNDGRNRTYAEMDPRFSADLDDDCCRYGDDFEEYIYRGAPVVAGRLLNLAVKRNDSFTLLRYDVFTGRKVDPDRLDRVFINSFVEYPGSRNSNYRYQDIPTFQRHSGKQRRGWPSFVKGEDLEDLNDDALELMDKIVDTGLWRIEFVLSGVAGFRYRLLCENDVYLARYGNFNANDTMKFVVYGLLAGIPEPDEFDAVVRELSDRDGDTRILASRRAMWMWQVDAARADAFLEFGWLPPEAASVLLSARVKSLSATGRLAYDLITRLHLMRKARVYDQLNNTIFLKCMLGPTEQSVFSLWKKLAAQRAAACHAGNKQ